jgi:DDE superfamily endonuclease
LGAISEPHPRHGGPAVDQLIPSLLELLAPLVPAFRKEVFPTFRLMFGAWVVCLGRRTISRVWETTGQSRHRHHAAAFRLFSQAVWNWDEVMRLLLVALLQTFVPGMRVWVVVDDTLCHKRGAKVAFGGIFLDAVLSTRKHKTFRFGNNWVLLGLVVSMPCRRDRPFCVPLLWRVYEKRGTKTKAEHRTKVDLATDMIRTLAGWLPGREILVLADSAYMGKGLLKDRPTNVNAIGPILWTAALMEVKQTRDGRDVSTGQRLPTPREILADDRGWPPQTRTITFGNGQKRRLQVKMVLACWPTVVGDRPVAVVLVRDPAGEWRDEALVSTNPALCDWEIVAGYCQRWSVEVAIADAKQQLGFHDPCVWKAESVQRAAPMAWFVGAVVLLWYARHGMEHRPAERHRPWYLKRVTTFADMLSCCRLAQWERWWSNRGDVCPANTTPEAWLLEYLATAA